MKRETGIYETLGEVRFFIPHSLPPKPPLELSDELTELYGSAMLRLGQLNEMASRLPNSTRFIKAYVIKEALLSSAIEGIHTTLIELFTQPLIATKPNKEVQLVLNYTNALDVALEMIKEQNLPITSRVLLKAHEILMTAGEGDRSNPGQYRKQPVRVGTLVPPPAPQIPELMAHLEKYINSEDSLPPLIKAGLAHVQFETIHPFLDGNGRIGRLLIVLMLIDSGLLTAPILYPSYYFKKHHREYYERLDKVRTHGDFEGWIQYYLKGIEMSSFDAYRRAKDIEALALSIKEKAQTNERFSKLEEYVDQTLSILFQSPIINITELSILLDKSYNTAAAIIKQCVDAGILIEVTDQKRNKLYRFDLYLQLLEKEYSEEEL